MFSDKDLLFESKIQTTRRCPGGSWSPASPAFLEDGLCAGRRTGKNLRHPRSHPLSIWIVVGMDRHAFVLVYHSQTFSLFLIQTVRISGIHP